MSQTVRVAVRADSYAYDRPYTYLAPEGTRLLPGVRVLVPFGAGNRPVQGIVLAVSDGPAPEKAKTVLSALDAAPLLSEEDLRLMLWLRGKCFCTCYDVLRAMIPAGLDLKTSVTYRLSGGDAPPPEEGHRLYPLYDFIRRSDGGATQSELERTFPELDLARDLAALSRKKLIVSDRQELRGVSDKKMKYVRLIAPPDGVRLGAKQAEVVDFLRGGGEYSVREVNYYTGAAAATIRRLADMGLVAVREQTVPRLAIKRTGPGGQTPDPALNAEQQAAFDGLAALCDGTPHAALLHGVTGSGKTMVYIRLIRKVLAQGRGAIVLVPEISLTPQLLDRFVGCFGDRVALIHSSLSVGERSDEWKRIRAGKADVVVGTRSAVFAPVKDLGLIVLDEEQEHTYRSEQSPRYHARDVARFRAAAHGALMLLGSATPSVESMYAARTGRYSLFRLTTRFGGAALPRVVFSDMGEELRRGNGGMIGEELAGRLARTFAGGHQAILFLNRRGNSRCLFCRSCGKAVKCPNCSVSLTYHSANDRLMCHYCGHSEKAVRTCPSCGSAALTREGGGTQRAEAELRELFPGRGIIRMDADTTSGKESHEKLLSRFRDENVPMLLGTQMIAKGLDFPNVTLVGVLDGDQLLNVPDFRAAERTFSMVTQAVGRAGRGSDAGGAVIQTCAPDDPVLRAAAAQDYDGFFRREIAYRKAFRYPPFCELLVVELSGTDNTRLYTAAAHVCARLAEVVGPDNVFPPSPAPVFRLNNKLRYRVIAKTADTRAVRDGTAAVLRDFLSRRIYKGIGIAAAFDPFE
ncbi:MAG: primosomal protein N' [Oscillospiraceae bacterium]|nr:primosomal protein N' [Oscillospiraceae bacterium]